MPRALRRVGMQTEASESTHVLLATVRSQGLPLKLSLSKCIAPTPHPPCTGIHTRVCAEHTCVRDGTSGGYTIRHGAMRILAARELAANNKCCSAPAMKSCFNQCRAMHAGHGSMGSPSLHICNDFSSCANFCTVEAGCRRMQMGPWQPCEQMNDLFFRRKVLCIAPDSLEKRVPGSCGL